MDGGRNGGSWQKKQFPIDTRHASKKLECLVAILKRYACCSRVLYLSDRSSALHRSLREQGSPYKLIKLIGKNVIFYQKMGDLSQN